jgi:KaiC/GvpD/RAD55 family RecA-like ATPase
MMSGGIPAGGSALFVGPSGAGKSLFARHFIEAGAEAGEPGIIVLFEEHPGEYLAQASAFGPRLASFAELGLVEILYLRPLDLTVERLIGAGPGSREDRRGGVRAAIARARTIFDEPCSIRPKVRRTRFAAPHPRILDGRR